MGTKKLTILGFSAPTITMIMDAMQSNRDLAELHIINNLHAEASCDYSNAEFSVVFSQEPPEDSSGFFLGVYRASTKMKVHELFPHECITLVHATAHVSTAASLGSGCLLNSNCSVAAHAKIGRHVSINRNSSVGHHTMVGDFSTINPGAHIAGFAELGMAVTVGMGSCVLDGVKVGDGSVIGAGSVVTKDIPAGVVAFGAPCRVVKRKE